MTQEPNQPSFAGWMGSMWLYTILRYGMFLALWGVFYLVGAQGLLAGVLAAVISVPLAYVVLQRPRERFAANFEQRVNAHRESRSELDEKLAGEGETG